MRIATVIALVAGFVLLAIGLTVEGAFTVVFGWIPFLWRVLPEVKPDGPSVLVGAIAILVFASGVHWFGRSWRGGWRLRWTGAVVLGVVLLFTAGIAMIGITHQVAWLSTSDQPVLGEGIDRRGESSNQLRYLGLGALNYESSNKALPPGGTFGPNGEGLHSWETHVLPYAGYYGPINMERPWNGPENEQYFKCVVPLFINPEYRTPPLTDANGFGLSHYAANSRVMSANKPMKLSEITNGESNTILIGEVNAGFKPWGHPINFRDPAAGLTGTATTFGGPTKTGGTLFVMADGSIRFVRSDVDPAVLRAMSDPHAK